jgi:hypothetical protein
MSKIKAKFILKPIHKALVINTPIALIDAVLGGRKIWVIRLMVMLIVFTGLVVVLINSVPTVSNPASPIDKLITDSIVLICCILMVGIVMAIGEMFSLPGGFQYNLGQLREARDRLQFGVLLDGEIMEVDGGKYSDLITIYYEFYTPEQKRLVGSSFAYRPDLKGRVPLIGTPIHVLYMNEYGHEAL